MILGYVKKNVYFCTTDNKNMESDKLKKENITLLREKLAGHCFVLAQATFTALVLGSILVYFQEDVNIWQVIAMLAFGIIMTIGFTVIGSNLLKPINKK